MNARTYETASTSNLEAWLQHPRSSEDARRIREELRTRGGGLPDTGTMPLQLDSDDGPVNAEAARG